MRENMALLRWLETATSGIRFGPDRLAVRAELYAHLEDKTLDLIRVFPGMDPDEARDRALAGMGDAEELKTELARIHRPWLGYLWQASRWLLWAMSALCLVLLINCFFDGTVSGLSSGLKSGAQVQALDRELFGDEAPSWEGVRLALCAPGAEARMGGGTISVPAAAWWLEEGEDVLYLQVRITWDRPWEVEKAVVWHVQVRDGEDVLDSIAAPWSGNSVLRGWNWAQRTIRLPGASRGTEEVQVVYLPGVPGVGPALTVDLSQEVEP